MIVLGGIASARVSYLFNKRFDLLQMLQMLMQSCFVSTILLFIIIVLCFIIINLFRAHLHNSFAIRLFIGYGLICQLVVLIDFGSLKS